MTQNYQSFLPPVNIKLAETMLETQNVSPNIQLGAQTHAFLGERN